MYLKHVNKIKNNFWAIIITEFVTSFWRFRIREQDQNINTLHWNEIPISRTFRHFSESSDNSNQSRSLSSVELSDILNQFLFSVGGSNNRDSTVCLNGSISTRNSPPKYTKHVSGPPCHLLTFTHLRFPSFPLYPGHGRFYDASCNVREKCN